MQMTVKDFLKRALLDSQEHIRDYMQYAERAEDPAVSELFRRFAHSQGAFASEINQMLDTL